MHGASGDQSDEQQAAEEPIGLEEQRNNRKSGTTSGRGRINSKNVNEVHPRQTAEEIIGKAQEEEAKPL